MITGKGMYYWRIRKEDGNDPSRIVQQAKQAGLSHIIFKVVDGILLYNCYGVLNGYERWDMQNTGVDFMPAVVEACWQAGIQPWGYQYIYGRYPEREAEIAIRRIKQLNLAGFVVNAESEFKGKELFPKSSFPARESEKRAETYMKILRLGIKIPIAFSSFRYPNLHRPVPFEMFLQYSDLNMPQVYWMGTKTDASPGFQLKKSTDQYNALVIKRPIFPTGAAYGEAGWRASASQVSAFLKACKEQGYDGANFWEWRESQELGGDLWQAVSDFREFGDVLPEPPPLTDAERIAILENEMDMVRAHLNI